MKDKPRLHSGHVEVAVANLINYRTHLIVPNISWGWGLRHEADLIAVNSGNKVTEIEIKISLSDLKADFKKWHGHKSSKIGRLVYAIPQEMLEAALEIIPKDCGIITVKWNGYRYSAKWERSVRYKKDVQPISNIELISLMRLGAMRIWSLKERFAYMRSGTCTNLNFSTNVSVSFLIYAVMLSLRFINEKLKSKHRSRYLFFCALGIKYIEHER